MRRPRLVITPGDPLGVGPEVTAKALKELAADGMPVDAVVVGHSAAFSCLQRAGLDVPFHSTGSGRECAEVEALRVAVRWCLDGTADALVTGPIHKGRLAARGFAHPGHTTFLGELCGVERPVMAFVGGAVRVSLVTVHVPLAKVPSMLTRDAVAHTIRASHQALVGQLGLEKPRLLLCGLNPHAGDDGLMGDEEARILKPAAVRCQREGIDVQGPISAETAFRKALHGEADMVIATYHDQGLAPLKALDALTGAGAVNWTLGLPIIRTSVDHGTADDIAGRGIADPRSMKAALSLAATLVANVPPSQRAGNP